MSCLTLIKLFHRLEMHCVQNQFKRHFTRNSLLQFKATPILMAEPLKKKKKLDPAVVKAREDRKKKKIEKQIRRLEKNALQLKPIEECEVTLTLIDEKKHRLRSLPPHSVDTLEKRFGIEKQWAVFKKSQHLVDIQMLDRIAWAQQRALDELKKESEELYREAVQIDFHLVPYRSEGPVETCPKEDYESPDGDYVDVSKKWE